jgi:hypothetical protein
MSCWSCSLRRVAAASRGQPEWETLETVMAGLIMAGLDGLQRSCSRAAADAWRQLQGGAVEAPPEAVLEELLEL